MAINYTGHRVATVVLIATRSRFDKGLGLLLSLSRLVADTSQESTHSAHTVERMNDLMSSNSSPFFSPLYLLHSYPFPDHSVLLCLYFCEILLFAEHLFTSGVTDAGGLWMWN